MMAGRLFEAAAALAVLAFRSRAADGDAIRRRMRAGSACPRLPKA